MSLRQPNAEELESSCFHHKDKSCQIVWYPLPKKEDNKQLYDEDGKKIYKNIVMCKTHRVRLCYAQKECFFEIGTHFGQLSLGYKAPYSLDNYPYDDSEENPIESLG